MYGLLLVIIYLAFISLGLPDSMLGSGWPAMQQDLAMPLSSVGILTTIVAIGTIVSSLQSSRLTHRFGTHAVTVGSILLTAFALLGYALSSSFFMLCIFAIPYGIGAGGVDAALNNYVALHFSSKHMNWLHASWGVGASISPFIMSFSLQANKGWSSAFLFVSMIQFILVAIIALSFPLWKQKANAKANAQKSTHLSLYETLSIRGVPYLLITFFAYCALEASIGLWSASYLIATHDITLEAAASFASFFFIGITVGRFFSGFISHYLGDKNMLRLGITLLILGLSLLFIPVSSNTIALISLVLMGLGCAPIYPSIIHATPSNFGSEYSASIIGVQMASAYTGATFIPPLFGILATSFGLTIFPVYILLFTLLMLCMSEVLNALLSKHRSK